MSARPEEEDDDEREEEDMIDEDDLDFGDDDEVLLNDGGVDDLLSAVLSTPDGDTVCSALVHIGHQLEMQNKILIKILSKLT